MGIFTILMGIESAIEMPLELESTVRSRGKQLE
jgi:hypothetical protein